MLKTLENFSQILKDKRENKILKFLIASGSLETIVVSKIVSLLDEEKAQALLNLLNSYKINNNYSSILEILISDDFIEILDAGIEFLKVEENYKGVEKILSRRVNRSESDKDLISHKNYKMKTFKGRK